MPLSDLDVPIPDDPVPVVVRLAREPLQQRRGEQAVAQLHALLGLLVLLGRADHHHPGTTQASDPIQFTVVSFVPPDEKPSTGEVK